MLGIHKKKEKKKKVVFILITFNVGKSNEGNLVMFLSAEI